MTIRMSRRKAWLRRGRARNACPALILAALAAGNTAFPQAARGADAPYGPDKVASRDLADLSLEELGSIVVTSVSRQPEKLADAAASIYVITADDIRRSGATTLPEALRLAPNLEVARTTAYQYAISARGFNNADNKLLVLIDGRIVYTPLYSGVLWYEQDVMLEDVDRIEVISGPGGTLWGSNAVNGVINIITRPAGDTQGALAAAGGGNREYDAAARYGGQFAGGSFRIYAKDFDQEATRHADGTAVNDAWERAQVGFRSDWGEGERAVTVQGDAYRGRIDQGSVPDAHITGANLLSRWTHAFDGGGRVQLQAYFDQSVLNIPGAPGVGRLYERLNIGDIEFQHTLAPLGRHTVTWGTGWRGAQDNIENPRTLAFLPADKDLAWINVYAQDEFALAEHWTLTGGGKLEHNSYSGAEFMPSLRLAWKLAPQQLLWSALSRAVRTPSRLDHDLYTPAQPPYTLAGGPNFQSEIADVAEIGYRTQPTQRFSYSVTVFHNEYERLRSVEQVGPFTFQVANKMAGDSTGVELWGAFQATDNWRLSAGGTTLSQHLHLKGDSTDLTGVSAQGNDPAYQVTLRSALNLPADTEFDIDVRHVAELPAPRVPAYTAVDLRVGWHITPKAELSLAVQNLFDPGHIEFGAAGTASETERSVFLKLLLRM